VALYEKLAEDNDKEAAQYTEEAASIKAAIANFKKDDQTIVLGNTSTEPLNLKNENKAYNNLVTKYIEAGTEASSAAEDAKYYRSEAVRFQTALPTNRENSLKAAQAEESINLLRDKLDYWTGIINDTARDYDSQATYQHYAEQLMPARSYESLQEGPSMALMAAIGLVLGLVLGVLVVLFRVYMKEDYFKREEQEVAGDEN
jgi:CRISPR/Cas system-associated protein Cas7 (RAMP superfamily)